MTKRSKFGWVEFLLGLLLVGLGAATFFNPRYALSGIVVIYSVLAIIGGIADIVFYVRLKSNTGFGPTVSLVMGIITILAGFMLLLNPMLGSWLIVLCFSVWFIARSLSRLANNHNIRAVAGKGTAAISLVLNLLGIVLGALMLINPAVSTLSLGYVVAAALLVFGVNNIVEAFSRLGGQETIEQIDLADGEFYHRESGE